MGKVQRSQHEKGLCVGIAVGQVHVTPDGTRQNHRMAIQFPVFRVKKNWNNRRWTTTCSRCTPHALGAVRFTHDIANGETASSWSGPRPGMS